MIDADIPSLPNADLDIVRHGPGEPSGDPVNFSLPWYRFVNNVQKFMATLRNAPKAVEQADIAKLAIKLAGAKKTGLQIWVPAPYNHLLRWNGTAFEFAPGDSGSGYAVEFVITPNAPGWAACDGSTTTYLLPTGEIAEQVLPTGADVYFRR